MIHFTANLHNYMMFEVQPDTHSRIQTHVRVSLTSHGRAQVLETSWHKLVKDLKAAKDLDELIDSHEDYIDAIKKNVRLRLAAEGRLSEGER